jgi:hypothetical protein
LRFEVLPLFRERFVIAAFVIYMPPGIAEETLASVVHKGILFAKPFGVGHAVVHCKIKQILSETKKFVQSGMKF